MTKHIVLMGEMGVGKTTVGERLAARLRRPFHDSDYSLAASEGVDAADIASRHGVEALHELELEALLVAVGEEVPSVIAAAASVVDQVQGRDAIERCFAVWLTARDDVLAGRRSEGEHRRPVDHREVEELKRRRRPWFEALAELTVDTAKLDPSVAAEHILARVARRDL